MIRRISHVVRPAAFQVPCPIRRDMPATFRHSSGVPTAPERLVAQLRQFAPWCSQPEVIAFAQVVAAQLSENGAAIRNGSPVSLALSVLRAQERCFEARYKPDELPEVIRLHPKLAAYNRALVAAPNRTELHDLNLKYNLILGDYCRVRFEHEQALVDDIRKTAEQFCTSLKELLTNNFREGEGVWQSFSAIRGRIHAKAERHRARDRKIFELIEDEKSILTRRPKTFAESCLVWVEQNYPALYDQLVMHLKTRGLAPDSDDLSLDHLLEVLDEFPDLRALMSRESKHGWTMVGAVSLCEKMRAAGFELEVGIANQIILEMRTMGPMAAKYNALYRGPWSKGFGLEAYLAIFVIFNNPGAEMTPLQD